jgi:glycosyltransferase involved in cell wall biosynthesis
MTPHNTLGKWGMRYRRPLLKRLSMGLIEGRMLDGANRIHLCSADELTDASRIRSLGERSRVFPLGIDPPPELVDHSDSDIGQLRDKLAGRPVVLFMSRIHEIKGLDNLLTAFAAVRRKRPDAVLLVAGTGDELLVGRMRDMARQLGIEDQTHWLGFVVGRPKQELLSMATVFVLPSHSENFGYAVVEALLAGVVTVTTVHVASGEFVAATQAGVVYDGSLELLERGILQVLNMPENERRSLGAHAATVVRERLSLPTYGKSLERIYREALGTAG